MKNILYNNRVENVYSGATAGTSAQTSSFVDMQDADGVCFMGRFGVSGTGGNTAQLAQASATSAAVTALGSTIVTGVKKWRIEGYRPSKRYVRVNIARGTSSVTGDVWAVVYGLKKKPATGTAEIAGTFTATPT